MIIRLLFLLCMISPCVLPSQAASRKLWYLTSADESAHSAPVDKSTTGRKLSRQALPLGNGRIGCMPYGGVENEFVEFNEDSLWITITPK